MLCTWSLALKIDFVCCELLFSLFYQLLLLFLSLSSSESICTNFYFGMSFASSRLLVNSMNMYNFTWNFIHLLLSRLCKLYIAFHDLFPSQNLVKHFICWRLIIDNRNKMTQVSIFHFLISFFLETFTYKYAYYGMCVSYAYYL